jgi:hypothetical protein
VEPVVTNPFFRVFPLRAMEKPFERRTFTRMLGALALSACSLAACSQEAAAPPSAPAPVEHRAYRYDGVSGTSQVTHEKAADGQESLRGTTDLAAGSGNAPMFARETVRLDAQGRLGHAEIIVGERGAAVQYTLDPSRGAVHVVRPGAPAVDWLVPNDAPWMYAPNPDDEGTFIATPVAAWVALRAASASDVVRVLEPEQRRTYLLTVDQVVVPTEHGTTVALGSDGVDADAQFISELRLLHGAVTLARVSARDLVPRT